MTYKDRLLFIEDKINNTSNKNKLHEYLYNLQTDTLIQIKDKERFINAIKHKLNGTERSDVLVDIEAGAADISDIKVY
jgi:hypothetical protein